MSTLYVVGTPIGNLQDLSERALETLQAVDLIACEDTRHTQVLLDRYDIKTPTVSYHQHSSVTKIDWLLDRLKAGQSIALVTDAGTPGLADPGGLLVEAVHRWNQSLADHPGDGQSRNENREYRHGGPISIESIPGPSSITTALSVAGFPADQFLFLGFLPKKKGRQSLLRSLTQLDKALDMRTIVFFESAIRIHATLQDIADAFAGPESRVDSSKIEVCLARELTKKFEEIWRGSLEAAITKTSEPQKGEFVVILYLGR